MMINICFLSLRRTVTAANNSTSCLPMKKEFYAPRLWDLIKAKLDNARGGNGQRSYLISIFFCSFFGVLGSFKDSHARDVVSASGSQSSAGRQECV